MNIVKMDIEETINRIRLTYNRLIYNNIKKVINAKRNTRRLVDSDRKINLKLIEDWFFISHKNKEDIILLIKKYDIYNKLKLGFDITYPLSGLMNDLLHILFGDNKKRKFVYFKSSSYDILGDLICYCISDKLDLRYNKNSFCNNIIDIFNDCNLNEKQFNELFYLCVLENITILVLNDFIYSYSYHYSLNEYQLAFNLKSLDIVHIIERKFTYYPNYFSQNSSVNTILNTKDNILYKVLNNNNYIQYIIIDLMKYYPNLKDSDKNLLIDITANKENNIFRFKQIKVI